MLKSKFENFVNIKFLGKKTIKEIIAKAAVSDVTFGMATTLLTLMQCPSLAIACYAYSDKFYLPTENLQFNYMEEPINQESLSISEILSKIEKNKINKLLENQRNVFEFIYMTFINNFESISLEIESINSQSIIFKRISNAISLSLTLFCAYLLMKIRSRPSL